MFKANKKLSDYKSSRLVSNSTLKSGKSINKISKTGSERNEKYFPIRDEYFKNHPICEFPGCNSTDLTLHHKAGRIGNLLFDHRYFMSVCLLHHHYIETNPAESYEKGWLLKL